LFGENSPPENFWKERITTAFHQRKSFGLSNAHTNAYRLIHGEGDGLPGLIIDVYDTIAVVQTHSLGMHADRNNITNALINVLEDSINTVYYKSKTTLPGNQEDTELQGYLNGNSNCPAIVRENDLQFLVNWEEGQKTGFFLDQRDNRKLLGEFSAGKAVLNTFCYTGGFSVYALKFGASLVHSVDASEKAIELSKRNLELNGFDPIKHSCYAIDTFEFLKGKEGVYDLIVLDPPAFAKHRDSRHQAVKGYQRLNAEAMKVIKPGGILFTFSCSQVVDRDLFYNTIVSAAIQANRNVKVLARLSQPSDHPVSIFHPEGEYLKGMVLHVE
jgi:23S rRNA (cytosine1962-C5)-methyltransferase